MNTKHTPGPWKVDRHGVNVMDPREKNYTIANCHGASVRELEANAKLIAASPDLLAALQNALNVLAGVATGDLKTVTKDSPAIAQARAAIARATN